MASKMLLIITYSSMVFWLILSVTCRWKCFISSTNITQSGSNLWLKLLFFVCLFLTVTKQSSNLRQRLLRLSELSPQRRLSRLSIRSCRSHKQKVYTIFIYNMRASSLFYPFYTPIYFNASYFLTHFRLTFILCSALSKPMSMLMMSKPDADLFLWCTPRKSAHRVWGEGQRAQTLKRENVTVIKIKLKYYCSCCLFQ